MSTQRIIAGRPNCSYLQRSGALLSLAVSACLLFAVLDAAVARAADEAFGVETFANSLVNENGAPVTQAGSHPYAMTTTLMFNHHGSGVEILPTGVPRTSK